MLKQFGMVLRMGFEGDDLTWMLVACQEQPIGDPELLLRKSGFELGGRNGVTKQHVGPPCSRSSRLGCRIGELNTSKATLQGSKYLRTLYHPCEQPTTLSRAINRPRKHANGLLISHGPRMLKRALASHTVTPHRPMRCA